LPQTFAIAGDTVNRRFKFLVNWARGGAMEIVTPYITDFVVGAKNVSNHVMDMVRARSRLRLLVAPPDYPHKAHNQTGLLSCSLCREAARKVDLLNRYHSFAEELMVKDNLHAKIYIATNQYGQKACLTGSVNLTSASFNWRAELGIYTVDQELIQQVEKIIRAWKGLRSTPRVMEYVPWRKDFLVQYSTVQELLESRDRWT
jgi:phosphatidylserine/phosphatidylglycerophosphate/cardiolipin synthase-like enzyme